jgi:hypothetical protein
MSEEQFKQCGDAIDPDWRKVDFSTFVLSLGTSVMMHLGQGPSEGDSRPEVNLPLARHVIDIIAMLKEKTRGNLDEDEDRLVETVLFDLRLKFVDACKSASSVTQAE